MYDKDDGNMSCVWPSFVLLVDFFPVSLFLDFNRAFYDVEEYFDFTSFEPFLFQMQDCKHVSPEKGRLVNCLVEHREHAKDQKCRAFLHKMASIVYGDYRLIYGFYQACKSSVVKHNCGKIQTKNENVSAIAFPDK